MLIRFFLLLVLVPVFEIYVLLRIGSVMGSAPTVGLVLLTAAVGAWLTRRSGLRALLRMRANIDQGIVPADEMLDAFFILIAGIFLLTPGFVTDGLGFLLLFSPSRELVKRYVRRKLEQWRNTRVEIVSFSDRDI